MAVNLHAVVKSPEYSMASFPFTELDAVEEFDESSIAA